jgi:hypothetical protein
MWSRLRVSLLIYLIHTGENFPLLLAMRYREEEKGRFQCLDLLASSGPH